MRTSYSKINEKVLKDYEILKAEDRLINIELVEITKIHNIKIEVLKYEFLDENKKYWWNNLTLYKGTNLEKAQRAIKISLEVGLPIEFYTIKENNKNILLRHKFSRV